MSNAICSCCSNASGGCRKAFRSQNGPITRSPRIRSEAIRLQLTIPDERDEAIRTALWDVDPRVVRVGLAAIAQKCEPDVANQVAYLAVARDIDEEIRLTAVAVLGRISDPSALEALVSLADGGRTLLGDSV